MNIAPRDQRIEVQGLDGPVSLVPQADSLGQQLVVLVTAAGAPALVHLELREAQWQYTGDEKFNAVILDGNYKIIVCAKTHNLEPTDVMLYDRDNHAFRVYVRPLDSQPGLMPGARLTEAEQRMKPVKPMKPKGKGGIKIKLSKLDQEGFHPVLKTKGTLTFPTPDETSCPQAIRAVLATVLCNKEYYKLKKDYLGPQLAFVDRVVDGYTKEGLSALLHQNQGSFDDAVLALGRFAEETCADLKPLVEALKSDPELFEAARSRWPTKRAMQPHEYDMEFSQYIEQPQMTQNDEDLITQHFEQLVDFFGSPHPYKTIRFVEISGEAGVGKTTLAQAYGSRRPYGLKVMTTLPDAGASMRSIKRPRSSEHQTLEGRDLSASKRKILSAMGLDSSSPHINMQCAFKKLPANTTMLIILDSISLSQDLAELVKFDVTDLREKSSQIDIVVTSRTKGLVSEFLLQHSALAQSATLLPLEVFPLNEEQSVEFLLNRCKSLHAELKSSRDEVENTLKALVRRRARTFFNLQALSRWINELYQCKSSESCLSLSKRIHEYRNLYFESEDEEVQHNLEHGFHHSALLQDDPLRLALDMLQVRTLGFNAHELYKRFAILLRGDQFTHILLRILLGQAFHPSIIDHFEASFLLRRVQHSLGVPQYCDINPRVVYSLHDNHISFARKLVREGEDGELMGIEEVFLVNFLSFTQKATSLVLAAKDPYIHEFLYRHCFSGGTLGLNVLVRFFGSIEVLRVYYSSPSGRFKITQVVKKLQEVSRQTQSTDPNSIAVGSAANALEELKRAWQRSAEDGENLKLVGDIFKALGESIKAENCFRKAEECYKEISDDLHRAMCLRELSWACGHQAYQPFCDDRNRQDLLERAWGYACEAVRLFEEVDAEIEVATLLMDDDATVSHSVEASEIRENLDLNLAIAYNVLADTAFRCADREVVVQLPVTHDEDYQFIDTNSQYLNNLWNFLNRKLEKLLANDYETMKRALRNSSVFCRTEKNMASIHLRRGDVFAAFCMLEEVARKETTEAPYDYPPPHRATTLEKLGDVCLKHPDLGSSLDYYSKCLEIRQAVFAIDHQDVRKVYDKLQAISESVTMR